MEVLLLGFDYTKFSVFCCDLCNFQQKYATQAGRKPDSSNTPFTFSSKCLLWELQHFLALPSAFHCLFKLSELVSLDQPLHNADQLGSMRTGHQCFFSENPFKVRLPLPIRDVTFNFTDPGICVVTLKGVFPYQTFLAYLQDPHLSRERQSPEPYPPSCHGYSGRGGVHAVQASLCSLQWEFSEISALGCNWNSH